LPRLSLAIPAPLPRCAPAAESRCASIAKLGSCAWTFRVPRWTLRAPGELIIRFPRTVANLKAAIQPLPMVLIFDNDVLAMAFRRVAEFRNGKPLSLLNRFSNGCVLCLTNSSGSSAAARRRFAISGCPRYGATTESPQLQASAIPVTLPYCDIALGSWIGLSSGCGSQRRGKKREKAAVKMLQSFNTQFAGDTQVIFN
jgi:hypothetical protein